MLDKLIQIRHVLNMRDNWEIHTSVAMLISPCIQRAWGRDSYIGRITSGGSTERLGGLSPQIMKREGWVRKFQKWLVMYLY